MDRVQKRICRKHTRTYLSELGFASVPDMVKFVVPTVLWATECCVLVGKVQSLKGRFEVIQILRAFVVAHIFRLVQSLVRNNKLPSFSYMRKVFLLYHIPMTVVVGAFYTITHLFPTSTLLVVLVQFLLLVITLFIPKVMGLKRDSSDTSIVLTQHNYDAAINNSTIINTIMGTMGLTMDLQFTDHFINTLLAGLCVDLVVQLERQSGNFEAPRLLIVLGMKHIPCFMRFVQGKNKVHPDYYLRNVLLYYHIPVTVTVAVFYVIFSAPSKTLLLVIFLEIVLMVGMEGSVLKREELNQAMRLKLEQDINPNQASSPNNESVDAGSASVHDASNRVENAADAHSISDTNNFSRWIHKDRIGSGGFGAVFVAENRETRDIAAVKVLKDNHRPENVESIQKIQESENDIIPAQASSLNIELRHQQNLDAANNSISSTSNFGPPEICDPQIGDGGFSSVYDASKRGGENDAIAANSISNTTDFSKWVKGKRIGYGQYGNVYVLKHRETGEQRAVKELNIRENENDESIRQEVKILKKLKHHRNIVKYYGHNMDEQGHISLHMEYIQQGSLYDYMKKRGKLDEYLIRNFTVQILSGLFHLHRFKVVHRDIKPENLLVDSNETIKLVDFGLAKTLAKSVSKHSVGGTVCYAAPELLQNKPYHSSSEGSAADIWSLGCVIIEMFTGKLPEWPLPDPPQPHPPIPEGLCEEGRDFLKLCFIRNLADRPSAEKLLEHPFVKAQTGAE